MCPLVLPGILTSRTSPDEPPCFRNRLAACFAEDAQEDEEDEEKEEEKEEEEESTNICSMCRLRLIFCQGMISRLQTVGRTATKN